MKKYKYKFRVNEAVPVVPAAPGFANLLKKVNSQIPWYSKPWAWGGIATVATVAVVSGWLLNQKQIENPVFKHQVTVNEPVAKPMENNHAKSVEFPVVFSSQSTSQIRNKYVIETQGTGYNIPNAIHILDSIIKQIVVPPAENSKPIIYQNSLAITLPYDTFTIAKAENAGVLKLKNGNTIEYTANSWTDIQNKPISGPVQVLFREARNQAEMMIGGISSFCEKDEINSPFVNNGAFEIRAINNNGELKIARKKELVVNYKIITDSKYFAGFQLVNTKGIWENMELTQYSSDGSFIDGNQPAHEPVYVLKKPKGILAWIRALFRKPEYDTINNSGIAQNEPIDFPDDVRSFQIRETGWFASGRALVDKSRSTCNISFNLASNDEIKDGIYQIFLNSNTVVFHKNTSQALLSISKSDQCILLAFLANSNQVAILDAHDFDMQIKQGLFTQKQGMRRSGSKDIILNTYTKPIVNLNDLKELIVVSAAKKVRS